MKPKKSLGQNFLKSEAALRKIVEVGEVGNRDVVLEIGPGRGALTERLLEHAGQVIAVEKDRELIDFLQEKFTEEIKSKKLILINADILDFKASAQSLAPRAYKVIANIPYNITGAILKKFLSGEFQPERMILMVQQEVAQRIVAAPRRGGASGKESILSISVKAYGTPKLEMKVPARYFSPAPNVDSAIISIKNISRKNFTSPSALLLGKERVVDKPGEVDEEKFWEIVKKGFAHKRKRLSSNLKNVVPRDKIAPVAHKRAEDLSLEDWKELARA